ncbi:MAG: iron-sulfur cluster assembly scaffold protein [Syntrophales bacterium]|nr:iron-sulfur cluster assembly scaffold protein [Syntrophales bacterium]
MKIAITASGEDFNSPVDRVFGRAKYFVITDPEETSVEVLGNSQNVNAAQGAGIQAAQQIANKCIDVLLTGNVGPNAFRALDSGSIKVFQFENEENKGDAAEEKPFSEKLFQHIMKPTHMGEMDKPSGHAVITGPCGDTDEFFVKIFSSRIQEIRFRTTGCFFTIAACDAVATLAEGRMVREALRINEEAVIEYLGGLPDDHKHCALLAANTLHRALRAYVIRGTGL